MLEFLSARHLRYFRCWRPSQIQRLLGRPDAIFAQSKSRLPQSKRLSPDLSFAEIEHLYVRCTVFERFYLRSRVEAEERRGSRWFDKRSYVRSTRMWTSLYGPLIYVLDAVDALYCRRDDPKFADADRMSGAEIRASFEELQARDKGLDPLYRLNDTLHCRCIKCGKLLTNSDHAAADCLWWRKPPRIEMSKSGYVVVAPDGSHLAHFFNAAWALPLVMAIARKPVAAIDGPANDFRRKGRRRREPDQRILPLLEEQ